MTPVLRWEWLRGPAALEAISHDWQRLMESDSQASVFHHRIAALQLWRSSPEVRVPVVLAGRSASGELQAALALSEGVERVGRLTVPAVRQVAPRRCDVVDLLARDEVREPAADEAAEQIIARYRSWLVDLKPLRTGAFATAIARRGIRQKAATALPSWHHTSAINFSPDRLGWAAYVGRRITGNLRRQARQFTEIGGHYRAVTSPIDVHPWLEQFRTLHVARQRSLNRSSSLDHEGRFENFGRAIEALFTEGVATLHALWHESAMVAGHIALRWRNRGTSYRIAFDERYKRYGPGIVLLSHVVDQAQQTGAEGFDLGWGEEPYKTEWATDHGELVRYSHAPRTPRYLMARATALFGESDDEGGPSAES